MSFSSCAFTGLRYKGSVSGQALCLLASLYCVCFGLRCLVKDEHTIDEPHNRVMPVPQPSSDFLNREAPILFLPIPVSCKCCLRYRIPLVRPVDVFEADILACLF